MFSILTGVKALFTNASDTSKSLDTLTDGIYNGIDKAIYTDEERSEANQKVLDFQLEYAKATSTQNLARRMIAIEVCRVWVLLVLVCVALTIFSHAKSKDVFDILAMVVTPPFTIIISFYFYKHVRANTK